MKSWLKSKSVSKISYVLFRILTEEDGEGYNKELGDILLKFPSLLVFKEGHTARNENNLVWKALEKVETVKRNARALEEVRDILSPLVHKCSKKLNKVSLPGIRDTIIHLKPIELQKELLKRVPENSGSFYEQNLMSLISVHPSLVNDVKLLLTSTKACSEDISLIGASRVVLLDVLWNPSVEQQPISQAYRNGQKYIYL
uniref:SNF2 N-terminal domain-containing protein n=1 Tax=Solanum lycopersicum TaxID=4081 RepID=K4CKZ4_SOLLC